jgi:transposase
MYMFYCQQCLEKQRRIDELEEVIVLLKAKLRYQERTAKEGFFGSSTPSSKIPVKANSCTEHQCNHGGGKAGHKGHGRKTVKVQDADEIQRVKVVDVCPDCGGLLQDKGTKQRTVIDCQPVKIKRILYYLEQKYCPKCNKSINAKPPCVLPKCLYSNNLLTYVAVQHYIYGNTLGQIEKQTGIGYSSLVDALHQLVNILKDVPKALIKKYRKAAVKHADETGWRTDGQNGFAWLFCTPDMSIYRFRSSRAGSVAKDVFGDKPLPGFLVVDRYGGYNKAPSKIQYCYAHLMRDVKDLEREFPDNPEIRAFIEALVPQLANAISLRTLEMTSKQFSRQAARIKDKIINIVNSQARHPAIQKIQDIFRQNADRLYHWAENRNVPADNNLSERELRPLVISRKISFGSQSVGGAATRETLMTVLHTLRKRTNDVMTAFKSILDKLAEQPDQDPSKLLFSFNSS